MHDRALAPRTGDSMSRTSSQALPRRRWQDMRWPEFRSLPQNTVAVLPVGAIEQHGPHLPVFVDSCINQSLLALALEAAPPHLPVTALPIQNVGKSDEHIAFPGTLTLSADTLTRMLVELGESVARAGVRRLLLLNSHGGQPQILDIVARTLRRSAHMFVVNASWMSLGIPDGLFAAAERQFGIHGGEIETSLMLHLRPDLVDMERARDFRSAAAEVASRYMLLEAEGRIGFGWLTQDLHPAGACGNAAAATAEKGRLIAEHQVARFLQLISEIADYDLERIRGNDTISDI